MDSFEKQALKQEALRRLRAQRQRAGQLRVRVVTIALIGFVLLWGVIFAQMATGHDPVIGDKSRVAAPSSVQGRAAGEAIETTDPEELRLREAAQRQAAEAAALEAAELEAAEAAAVEVEPAPVTTSQS